MKSIYDLNIYTMQKNEMLNEEVKTDWMEVITDEPYAALAHMGIVLDRNHIYNVPREESKKLSSYSNILDDYLDYMDAGGILEIDAIVIDGIGAFVNKEVVRQIISELEELVQCD